MKRIFLLTLVLALSVITSQASNESRTEMQMEYESQINELKISGQKEYTNGVLVGIFIGAALCGPIGYMIAFVKYGSKKAKKEE